MCPPTTAGDETRVTRPDGSATARPPHARRKASTATTTSSVGGRPATRTPEAASLPVAASDRLPTRVSNVEATCDGSSADGVVDAGVADAGVSYVAGVFFVFSYGGSASCPRSRSARPVAGLTVTAPNVSSATRGRRGGSRALSLHAWQLFKSTFFGRIA